MAPQPVDTKDLPKLGEAWLPENPYRGNTKAIEIGAAAFNQNCARCHGLGAVSGGIAPDLRYLPTGLDGDEWFLTRIRGGSTRDGRVYMPKFEGILSPGSHVEHPGMAGDGSRGVVDAVLRREHTEIVLVFQRDHPAPDCRRAFGTG